MASATPLHSAPLRCVLTPEQKVSAVFKARDSFVDRLNVEGDGEETEVTMNPETAAIVEQLMALGDCKLPDEEENYVARIENFPWVSAYGETKDQALAQLRQEVTEHLMHRVTYHQAMPVVSAGKIIDHLFDIVERAYDPSALEKGTTKEAQAF